MGKVFVQVVAEHCLNGTTRPVSIKWEDGRVFTIDRLLDVRMAPSLKGGGQGIRYTCRICGREVYLFNEENKWYIEK
jgi:hypothetical protein